MKKTLLNTLTFVFLCIASAANAQVGIGVPAGDIHPSAELEVKSTEKGFLLPRMTKAQRIAIGSPATGLIVYQTDGDVPNPAGLYYFDGLLWKNGIGAQGIQGTAGVTGPQGPVGAVGPKGDTGSQGPTGANGTNGAPGAKGDTGDQGIQGPKGDKGDVGATGPQGEVGPQGPSGANGTNGAQGLPGAQGIQGKTGDTGAQGPQGPAGVNGTNGTPGAKGDTGDQGIQGPKGDKGDVGATGPQGEVGPAGPKGDPGTSTGATPLTINSTVASIDNLLSFTNAVSGSAISSLQTNSQLKYNPGFGVLSVPSINATSITGSLTGNASSASRVSTTSLSTSAATYYPSFVATGASSQNSSLYVDDGLAYVPTTNSLSAGQFIGSLIGNVTGTASSASQVAVTPSVSTLTRYLSFAATTIGNADLQTNSALTYVPSTGTLSTTNVNASTLTGSLIGNASSASQVAVTPSSSNAPRYLSFSETTNGTTNLQTNVALNYIPATGTLSALNFMGNLTGNVTGNVTGSASSATQVAVNSSTSNAPRYLSFSETTNGNTNLQTNVALNYIPATSTLSALNFMGNLTGNVTGRLTGDVIGNATTATIASSATQVAVNSTAVAADRYLSFTAGSGSNSTLQISDNAQTALKYNPGTGVLTVPSIKTPTGTSSQYLMADGSVSSANPQGAVGPAGPKGDTGEKGEPGKDGVAGTSGQSVLFNPTTPPTNGMVVYKYFQNNKTSPLYDDGQILLRLNVGSGQLYLTNVNKNFANIWLNFGNGNFYNFGTGVAAMGKEVNVFGNFVSSNHQLQVYISAPDNPSYGLYVINIYFNFPTAPIYYSYMTVNYYKDPTATP